MITRLDFVALCGELLIDVDLALEDEGIAPFIREGDLAGLKEYMQENY